MTTPKIEDVGPYARAIVTPSLPCDACRHMCAGTASAGKCCYDDISSCVAAWHREVVVRPCARKVGKIYACIAGDHRYGTTIEVWMSATHVEIRHVSTGAVGGMDGDGRAFTNPARVVATFQHHDGQKLLITMAASWCVKELRRLFKTIDSGTIAKYGKPTKNFEWYVRTSTKAAPAGCNIRKGMSIAVASAAMGAV